MAGDVISLYRVKTISLEALESRFPSVEKSPPKGRELKASLPPSRVAGRQRDALEGAAWVKFAHRSRRNSKLRFFRVFKLFTTLKQEASRDPRYRPVADRLRLQRWMRRL